MAGEVPPELVELDDQLSTEAAEQLRSGEAFQDLRAVPYGATLEVTTANVEGMDTYRFYKIPPPEGLVGSLDRWVWLNNPSGRASNVVLKGAGNPAAKIVVPNVIKFDQGLEFYEYVESDATNPEGITYDGRPLPALHNLTQDDIVVFGRAGLLVGEIDGRDRVHMRWHIPLGPNQLTPPVTQVGWVVHGDNMSGRRAREDGAGES